MESGIEQKSEETKAEKVEDADKEKKAEAAPASAAGYEDDAVEY